MCVDGGGGEDQSVRCAKRGSNRIASGFGRQCCNQSVDRLPAQRGRPAIQ